MTIPAVSLNAQAILLLTAPLITGRGAAPLDLLSPGEYKRLARRLRELQHQPADLLAPGSDELHRACHTVLDETRLSRLLGRGFLLSQAIERWHTRAIWVISRADATYPRQLKMRLREDSPALLYGCGDLDLLATGGLAVVGSRVVNDWLIDYAVSVGQMAASSGRAIISGGARGIDQAAMRGGLEGGGQAIGVLADSLERTALNRENREYLLNGRLVLICPYDPNAAFNVGHAMQRNKVIYALADSSLVVNADLNKGGTWAGAVEQLDKLRMISVYVRSTGEASAGLDALRKMGALPWPNPRTNEDLKAVFVPPTPAPPAEGQLDLALFSEPLPRAPDAGTQSSFVPDPEGEPTGVSEGTPTFDVELSPADDFFAAVRDTLQRLLRAPMQEEEVAAALQVSTSQAKAWIQRLLDEGILETQTPSLFVLKQSRMFE